MSLETFCAWAFDTCLMAFCPIPVMWTVWYLRPSEIFAEAPSQMYEERRLDVRKPVSKVRGLLWSSLSIALMMRWLERLNAVHNYGSWSASLRSPNPGMRNMIWHCTIKTPRQTAATRMSGKKWNRQLLWAMWRILESLRAVRASDGLSSRLAMVMCGRKCSAIALDKVVCLWG